ncbi:NupC/NupG family nucleoside CNT transporter [Halalkalibacterium halodurans]|uniref:NupC/NupG family nucleoside CNT transporter n=1 Tax=Halalkalibacterium halodurans TaxID=86665 RepID=UPI002E244309|nr:NupC/NupG family nucleoside CNT transporter [Halalkalibacterium halodurans]MED4084746.1 NupC/NupG family nucleoside CNT transporter [Halalkalibacterium halodurans]MED4106146.1 NupC/NupG family nucleoside CNT transporter [Halalkalibacterium halodurans]MED4110661.1 NupC/NupG family nucleoside CNT transporter [Halalkalibacterium halodurans]MED4150510.1 NupC/NupG family nucleoside CNT transporter [Halalkalibacterium halodurans]
MNILWGLLGIVVVFLIAFAFSTNRRAIKPRTILGGLAIQLLFAIIVLKIPAGQALLESLTNVVLNIISYANEGIDFVFGGFFEEGSGVGFVFAINVLSVVIFFSALISILYYLGIMQFVIKIIGGALSWLLGTSKAESMSAAANIFVGQTEAPLVVKPYLPKMTQSELFAVMTGGLASVAGSVLIGYSLLGVPLEYLLAASFMAAPAGLIMAKMIMPETEKTTDAEDDFKLAKDEESTNLIDAAANGASTGLMLVLNIAAMLLAFVALIALVNGILGWIGGLFGASQLSLELILGYVFAPLAFVIGIPWAEALQAGSYIGQKLVVNEFVAYLSFAPEIENLSDKAVMVISFALCGFANFSSLGILLGGLGKLAPSRRPDIARLGLRAILAGTLASLLSASIAGMLF